MSEQPATYCTAEQLAQINAECLYQHTQQCACPSDAEGQPCFRRIPLGAEFCVPCSPESRYHGPGNCHGYGGVMQHPASGPVPPAGGDWVLVDRPVLDALKAALSERDDALGKLTALHARCETLATERDAVQARVDQPHHCDRAALHHALEQACQERDHLRYVIGECAAQRVPWADVLAAAGEGA